MAAAKARRLSEVIEILDSPGSTPRVAGKTPPMALSLASHHVNGEISRRQIEKALKRNGWTYLEGHAFGGAYCTPNVKLDKKTGKLSGVKGVDYFDSLEAFEDHVRSTPELMHVVRREVESGHLKDEETLTPTPVKPKKRLSYSGVAKSRRQSTEPPSPAQRDVNDIRFGEIDNILTNRGWQCVDGPLGFVYCKSHVVVSNRKSKFSGKVGEDYFYGRDDLEKYVRSNPHLLKSIRDELMAPSSDSESDEPAPTPSPATPKRAGRASPRLSSTPQANTTPKSNVTPTASSTPKQATPSKKTEKAAAAKPSSQTKPRKEGPAPAMLLPPKNKDRQSLESTATADSQTAKLKVRVTSPRQASAPKKRPASSPTVAEVAAAKKPRRSPRAHVVETRSVHEPSVGGAAKRTNASPRKNDVEHDENVQPAPQEVAQDQSSWWGCAIQ